MKRVREEIPHHTFVVVPGQQHNIAAKAVAPHLLAFAKNNDATQRAA